MKICHIITGLQEAADWRVCVGMIHRLAVFSVKGCRRQYGLG